jgi:aspartate/methionine/tyrosine aminotransferase
MRSPESIGSTFAVELERARASGSALLDLAESDPARCGLGWEPRKLESLLAASTPAVAQDELGAARDAVASYLAGRGASVSPERIHFTRSRVETYRLLLDAVCGGAGEVLVPSPSEPFLEPVAAAASVELRRYAIVYREEWRLDQRSVEKAVTPHTRAILVGNPSLPTGAMLGSEDLAFLGELCARRGIVLVADESLADTARDASACVLEATRCVSVHVSGVSGVCGVAGLAEWWAVPGPDESGALLSRLERAATNAARVPDPVLLAIPHLLAVRGRFHERLRHRVTENRAALALGSVGEAPWSLLWGRGGWWAVLEVGAAEQEERLCLALLGDGVAVLPGSHFGFPASGSIVLSLLPPRDVFGEALTRLDQRLRAPFSR